MKTIYVVGSINTDLSISAPYLPTRGETLTGSGFLSARGGKGANQAVAAARLGGRVVMCGCVGKDAFGKEAKAALKAEGIDVRFVRETEDAPTGTAVILVIEGDNRIILDVGANALLSSEDIDSALSDAREGDILLTQLENPVDVSGYALRLGREKGMFTVLNPAPANKAAEKYLSFCDLLIPNETEAEILGGRMALSKKVKNLLVTVGGDGFEHYTPEGVTRYPCMPVKVVDTTGAGDTFCGGLCTRLSEGESLIPSALFASTAASLACTKKGAQPAIPRRADVEKLF